MTYAPSPPPRDRAYAIDYLERELRRIASDLRADAPVVFYRTLHADAGTLSAGISANWKIAAGNVIRLSTSITVTLTGLQLSDPNQRELVLFNVGTGVLVLSSEDAASSASYRFALPTTWQLSANAAALLWYDPVSTRIRGIART